MAFYFRQLNVLAECRTARLETWQCPPFLFMLVGIITIAAMVGTYVMATRYAEEPEIAALIVIGEAAVLIVLGHFFIAGFNRLAEAHRMKSEFVSIVSHQLRSPLSIFKWTTDMLERTIRRGGNTEDSHSFLWTLHDTTEYMIHLVNTLLDVNRTEEGTLILKREEFSLPDLVRYVIKNFEAYAHASNVTMEFIANEEIPPISGDRDRILMVIQSFVDNAIRYSVRGGAISITVKKERHSVRITVLDRGVGIPLAQQKFIFQKFFRAENSKRFQTEGTGLGLYLARAIIEAAGGNIGFQSAEGKGSTFWFTLPL